jgi:hypothetical protein
MKRYVVSLRPSGIRVGLCDTIGEAVAMVTRVIESGKQASILDAQGSGNTLVTHFDLIEAEGYVGRSLGSEKIQRPTPLEEIIESIEASKPKKTAYHWGIDG